MTKLALKVSKYLFSGPRNTDLATLQTSAALGIKENHKLTQVATQGIIEGTTNLIQVCIRGKLYTRY